MTGVTGMTGMTVVFDGRLIVAGTGISLRPVDRSVRMTRDANAYEGQSNGLLGAVFPGLLEMSTGLHRGSVGFRLVVADQAPQIEDDWEDVVEASFVPVGPSQLQWWNPVCRFDLPAVPHRVRFSARGMDEARRHPWRADHAPVIDHYELAFWPAPPAPDVVVRKGSACAAYWHDENPRSRPAGLRGGSDAVNRLLHWAEPPLRSCLRRPDFAFRLPQFDPELAQRLALADTPTLRAISSWAARYACTASGLAAAVPEVALALDHLDRAEPLPQPFDGDEDDDEDDARWQLLVGDEAFEDLVYDQSIVADGRVETRWFFVMEVIGEAAHEDPLRAAVFALWRCANSFGDEHRREVLAEASRRFLS
ncbi:hypothetical protein KIH74_17665 [Kineosporia sp. J2-2]|uniref:Uncharacterized protein n=1 Tax=Kineosporia corallincola TaxID=2835133 RepID=A0ABS5TI57_9ACTN|nr:hypothetical protein [Kineosporia corallincola]MBT0770775.1 hypothetical protein [Kineosporia corallincola]